MKILRGSTQTGSRQNAAVLFSERSRGQLAREAIDTGSIYPFTGATGTQRHWLKGEFAYLAPVAQSTVLNRWNVKHDVVTEDALVAGLDAYGTLFVAGAGALAEGTVAALGQWLATPDRRLVVSGRTNLPVTMLGLASIKAVTPEGFTGWRWTPNAPSREDDPWGDVLVTGAGGYRVQRVAAAPGSRVLADLWDFGEGASGPAATSARRIGAGVVQTDRTLYLANDPFELLGAALQAHISVESIRGWQDPLHWADAIAARLWQILRPWDPELASLRLRTFGSHRGVLSLRHDVDASDDLSILEFEAANLVPATYHVLDPVISADATTHDQAHKWVRETAGYEFLEVGLHNDSERLEYVTGTGLYDHVRATEARLGIAVTNCGRHSRFHAHPETLDAMDYLYDNSPHTLGMCSFSFFGMIEYGHPGGFGPIEEALLTYSTDTSRTIATSGFWFPFHPVLTTVDEYKVLRGWDVTHEYDADYDLVDAILAGFRPRPTASGSPVQPRTPPWDFVERHAPADAPGTPENGVYTIQYHPLYSRDAGLNGGRGTLPYLAYAVAIAERYGLWIANKSMLHHRMCDYEDVLFRAGGPLSFVITNPTDRWIEGLVVESAVPAWALSDGSRLHVAVVDQRFLLLPPLEPKSSVAFDLVVDRPACPLLPQPERRGLVIVDAHHDTRTRRTTVDVKVTRRQGLLLGNLQPGTRYEVTQTGATGVQVSTIDARPEGFAILDLAGPHERAEPQRLEIVALRA